MGKQLSKSVIEAWTTPWIKRILMKNTCRIALKSTEKHCSAIDHRLQSYDINIKPLLSEFHDVLPRITTDKRDVISNHVENISTGLKQIIAGSSIDIALGTLSIVSALSVLIPFGQFVGPVCSLVSKMLKTGRRFRSSKDMHSGTEDVLKVAFQQFQDKELETESRGLMREFELSNTFLCSYEESLHELDEPINDSDVTVIELQVPILQGTKFLEILSRKIRELANTSFDTKVSSEKEIKSNIAKALKYLELYCYLSVFREEMFWRLGLFLVNAKASKMRVKGIKDAMTTIQIVTRNQLDFLRYPDPNNAMIVAHLDPNHYPLVCKFLDLRNVLQDTSIIENTNMLLHPVSFNDWYIAKEESNRSLKGLDDETMLTAVKLNSEEPKLFSFLKSKDSYYRIRPSHKLLQYARLDEKGNMVSLEKKTDTSDEEEQWKAIRIHLRNQDLKTNNKEITHTDDDNCNTYMLCTRKWPGYFIYMSNTKMKKIKNKYGNPQTKGFWYIEEE